MGIFRECGLFVGNIYILGGFNGWLWLYKVIYFLYLINNLVIIILIFDFKSFLFIFIIIFLVKF